MGKGPHFPEARRLAMTLKAKHPAWSAQRIVDEIETKYPEMPFSQADDRARTVRNWVSPKTARQTAGTARSTPDGEARKTRWSPWDPSHPSDPVLLEAHATQLEDPDRERSYLTLDEAEMMVRLVKLAPDAPVADLLAIARYYLLWSWSREPEDDLEALLAFAPWRDGGERLTDAHDAGAVKSLLWLERSDDDGPTF